jgi:hypothetical protein
VVYRLKVSRRANSTTFAYIKTNTMRLLSILSVSFLIIFSVNANAEQYEDWESKTYDVGEFTDIYLEGGYKVYLIQGDKNSITVKATDDDVFDELKIRNNSDELRLKVERDHFDYDRIILYITFKKLEKLEIEGGVRLKTKGYLDLDDFEMYVAGGAKIELDMKAENVKIFGEGGVLFELDGIAKSLDIKVSGAAHIDAEKFKSEDVSIKIEGVGTGTVYATETLYAKIEGVGKVWYSGNPKVTKHIEGLGSVKKNN